MNITGVQYFCTCQQGVVSSTSYFIIYPLSSFYFLHNFLPNSPFLPPPPPLIEYDAPSAWAGLQFNMAASPPVHILDQSDENNAPPASYLSALPLHFHRCNCCLLPAASGEELLPPRVIWFVADRGPAEDYDRHYWTILCCLNFLSLYCFLKN